MILGALATLIAVIAALAIGGRPDPPVLRAVAILLDGPWRFHTGDDPRWSDVQFEDQGWESLDLTAAPGSHDGDVGLPDYVAGWMAHGHPGYHGYAWYRRRVTVPSGSGSWTILGPALVEDGYEVYWNGQLLGASGRFVPSPRLAGPRPRRFRLPADAAGSAGVLAIRVYMLPHAGSSLDGGGMHTPPILAPQSVGDTLHRVQWQRTIAGYIVDVIEPVLLLVLCSLALETRSKSTRRGFLSFAAVALVFMAARRICNATTAWTDILDLATYSWLASVLWVPQVAGWTLAWNRWQLPAWRSIDLAALALAVAGVAGALTHSASLTRGIRLTSLALLIFIGVRLFGSGPNRILALVTFVSILAALFGGELLDPVGVPGIWFPFGIGVSRTQYVYAIFIPLLAFLIAASRRSSTGPRFELECTDGSPGPNDAVRIE